MNKKLIWKRFIDGDALSQSTGGCPNIPQGSIVPMQCLVARESRASNGKPTGGVEIVPVTLYWMNHGLTTDQKIARDKWDDENGFASGCWVSEHLDWALYNEDSGEPFLFTGWVENTSRPDFDEYYVESKHKVIAWRESILWDPSHKPYAELSKDKLTFRSMSKDRIQEAFVGDMARIIADVVNRPASDFPQLVDKAKELLEQMVKEKVDLDDILMDALSGHKWGEQ